MFRHRHSTRPLTGIAFGLSILTVSGPDSPAAEPLPGDVKSFLQVRCVRCHGEKKADGDLNIQALMGDGREVPESFKPWKAVASRVAAREMPPEGSVQPTDAERAALAHWYQERFLRTDGKPAGFRVRRLSTHEYRRTMESLFGFALDVTTAKTEQTKQETSLIFKLTPPDPRGPSGYTNDTSGSPLTPNAWERYAYFADVALAKLFGPDGRQALEAYTGPLAGGGITPDRAADLLDRFESRAWRRPIAPVDRARHADLVRGLSGAGLEAALKREMKLTLMSPEFFYRGLLTTAPSADTERLDGYELAERLSYFLWADMPDDGLIAAADGLGTAAGIEAQARRLLASPKARSLAEVFGTQWLQLDAIDNASREVAYVTALKGQPMELINHLFTQNRPLLELFDTRTEFVNAYLHNYYAADNDRFPKAKRRPGVEVEILPLERMELKETKGRGGLLTLPGILSMNKGPIQRGTWVLERILGDRLGEPPPDVPPVKPARPGSNLSFRERFAEHRANKACASCHDRIDPVGFAFEVYNDTGGYRLAANVDAQRALKSGRSKRDTAAVDASAIDTSGVLPTGERFNDFEEFKRLLTTALWPRVVENLVRQTLAYALGRELQAADEMVVEALTARLVKPGATWGDLVLGVVTSAPFREATYPAATP